MCSVAVKDWGVSSHDLTGVVGDDNLCLEVLGVFGWVLLGVRGNETTLDVLDGNVLDVETNVVPWDGLVEDFVVHLNRFALSGETDWGELDVDPCLEDTSLNTSDRDGSDTGDLVDILKRKAERLVGWALGWLDLVKGLK